MQEFDEIFNELEKITKDIYVTSNKRTRSDDQGKMEFESSRTGFVGNSGSTIVCQSENIQVNEAV